MNNKILIPLSAALVLAASDVGAQTPSAPTPMRGSAVTLEFIRPMIDDAELDFLSGAGFVAVQIATAKGRILLDLPFSLVGGDGDSSSGVGNILIGYETADITEFHFSARLPTAAEEPSSFFGFFADVQRWEAFIPDVFSARFGVTHRGSMARGQGFDVGGALVAFKPDNSDLELALDYGAHYVYRPNALGVTGGIVGRAIVTVDEGERTAHEARVLVDYTTGRVRPFGGIAFPLNNAPNGLDWLLRLGLTLGFGKTN